MTIQQIVVGKGHQGYFLSMYADSTTRHGGLAILPADVPELAPAVAVTTRPMYAGLEAGGTNSCAWSAARRTRSWPRTGSRSRSRRRPSPEAVAFFEAAVARGQRLDALGIASFGPVELRPEHPAYGCITVTPKAGWSGADVVGPFRAALGIPIAFDTDVNGAALAEGRWGAARDVGSFVYLTLGTGIGGGAVVEGRVVRGLVHPEMGHVPVPRRPGDAFAGVCPFHGDCLEGMASGTAIGARFGRRAETFDDETRDAAVEVVAFYLAGGPARGSCSRSRRSGS